MNFKVVAYLGLALLAFGSFLLVYLEPVDAPLSSEGDPVRREVGIGEEARWEGVGIVPEEILEDSRCPVNAICIQAGEVRLRARLTSSLGTASQEFKLGVPIATKAEIITLTRVLPAARAGVQIPEADYRLTFEVKKR